MRLSRKIGMRKSRKREQHVARPCSTRAQRVSQAELPDQSTPAVTQPFAIIRISSAIIIVVGVSGPG